jgi:hypothetical protein
MPYEVREHGTNKLMGTYSTKSRAVNKKNKLDNEYGGYHYSVINLDLVKAKDKKQKLKIKKA